MRVTALVGTGPPGRSERAVLDRSGHTRTGIIILFLLANLASCRGTTDAAPAQTIDGAADPSAPEDRSLRWHRGDVQIVPTWDDDLPVEILNFIDAKLEQAALARGASGVRLAVADAFCHFGVSAIIRLVAMNPVPERRGALHRSVAAEVAKVRLYTPSELREQVDSIAENGDVDELFFLLHTKPGFDSRLYVLDRLSVFAITSGRLHLARQMQATVTMVDGGVEHLYGQREYALALLARTHRWHAEDLDRLYRESGSAPQMMPLRAELERAAAAIYESTRLADKETR